MTDLAKEFHTQFATNQNHHQNLFFQILTLYLTVFLGYGFIYVNIGRKPSDSSLNITDETLGVFHPFALLLLTVGVALVVNIALGFRRDQLACTLVRIRFGAMKPTAKSKPLFLDSFNPIRKTGFLTWMPNFNAIFAFMLVATQILLIYALAVKLNASFWDYFLGRLATVASIAGPIALLCDLVIYVMAYYKWRCAVADAPAVMKE